MDSGSLELVQGTLELLILKSLRAGSRMHGFTILEWIYDATEGALSIEEGSLYPALHRMEKRGWLQAEWGVSSKGRRAKYYSLTPAGHDELRRQEERWSRYVAAVAQVDSVAEEA